MGSGSKEKKEIKVERWRDGEMERRKWQVESEHMKQRGLKGRQFGLKGSDRNQFGRDSCCEISITCRY